MENFIKVSWKTSKTDEPTDMYLVSGNAERADEMVGACAMMVRNTIEALAKNEDRNTATEYVLKKYVLKEYALKMIIDVLRDDAAEVMKGTTLVMQNGVLPDER